MRWLGETRDKLAWFMPCAWNDPALLAGKRAGGQANQHFVTYITFNRREGEKLNVFTSSVHQTPIPAAGLCFEIPGTCTVLCVYIIHIYRV